MTFTTEYWKGFLSMLNLGSDLEVTAKHIVDTMKEYAKNQIGVTVGKFKVTQKRDEENHICIEHENGETASIDLDNLWNILNFKTQ